jgi:hypothetical protein
MFKADLFIVGAPKCGTTALSVYLSGHPDIKISDPKEPYFFCRDFKTLASRPQYNWQNIDHYHEICFGSERYGYKVTGDATVWNLYSKVAGKNIFDYNPDAKFIVMLRNPVDMVYSLHSMYVGLGFENVRNFTKAFYLGQSRIEGQNIPPGSVNKLDPELLLYSSIGMLGQQLKRLSNIVPRENIKVVFFEDFSQSTLETYMNILDFLNVSYDNRKEFRPVNVQRRISSPFLLRLSQSQSLRQYVRYVKQIMQVKSLNLGIAKPPMTAETRAMLTSFYKEDILELSHLTGRSLNHWITQ